MAGFGEKKKYVVQTNPKVIARCLLMTTDPGDLVLDPTCGSGHDRLCGRDVGASVDNLRLSRVALSIARQRLLTATYPYYRIAYPDAGVSGGFKYETIPHITLNQSRRTPD